MSHLIYDPTINRSDIYGGGVHIYLRLVNTKGVAPGKLRALASVCSFPSLAKSSPLPEPEKDQNPLDLEPLPPIFNCSTLFSWLARQMIMLQSDCTRKGATCQEKPGRKKTQRRQCSLKHLKRKQRNFKRLKVKNT